MSEINRNLRKIREGWVLSDKMDKTRVVALRWSKRDPLYRKVRQVTTKIKAHDEKNESKSGDRVRLIETRPLSKTKRWRISEVLRKN